MHNNCPLLGCVCVCVCRYVALDKEMEEISCVWKTAKDHLNHHHNHHHVSLYTHNINNVYLPHGNSMR